MSELNELLIELWEAKDRHDNDLYKNEPENFKALIVAARALLLHDRSGLPHPIPLQMLALNASLVCAVHGGKDDKRAFKQQIYDTLNLFDHAGLFDWPEPE